MTIGTNVSSAMTSGTYKNTLELTAIANPLTVDYSLSFDGNSTGTVTGLPTTMEASSVASSYTFTIPNDVPTTSGYTFKEWNTEADGSGDSYAPGDDFTVSADDIAGTDQVLYAIWEERNFWSITYMQDMTPEICAAVTTPAKTATQADTDGSHHGNTAYVAQRTLYDYRGADGTGNKDNKVTPDSANAKSYMVRKLADGNCWMTQNLEIPLASGTTIEASYNTTASAYSFTPSAACSGNGACSMNANTKADNGTYYYSWYAATAETGTSTDVSTDTSASICPIGWRLPANYTIDQTKSYGSLTNSYGFTTNGANSPDNHVAQLESAPLNFARSGVYNGGLTYNGTRGYYWSSTAYTGAANAYYFFYNTSYTFPQDHNAKYVGFNVRCVAQ